MLHRILEESIETFSLLSYAFVLTLSLILATKHIREREKPYLSRVVILAIEQGKVSRKSTFLRGDLGQLAQHKLASKSSFRLLIKGIAQISFTDTANIRFLWPVAERCNGRPYSYLCSTHILRKVTVPLRQSSVAPRTRSQGQRRIPSGQSRLPVPYRRIPASEQIHRYDK